MPFDRSRYPDDWEEISEHIRFERAGGRCECEGECGVHDGPCPCEHGEANPRTGSVVVLTVAHLDHDPTNSDDGNLRAMCQQCHLVYDHDRHMVNGLRTRMEKRGQAAMPWAYVKDGVYA